jgi:tRNA U34 5-carboxymethylaminomethyl modifying GTPase MnmE/TrmE
MTQHPGYEEFQGIRTELIDIVDELHQVVDGIGHRSLVTTIDELRERVASDTFRVLVAGEFNAGKSTTINAMLGQLVLPSGATPTTAVLSVVRWGDEARANLYETDRQSDSGLDPTPLPIDVAELGAYVTVGASDGMTNKWGLAEIYWPLEFCRRGVEIVDSPGLNDSADHSKITFDYVNKADAVVFVFSALQALTETERRVVDQQLKLFSHDNMFCLVNRINQVEEADEAAAVVNDLRTRMKEYWDIGENRVFFVNSRGALRGRAEGQPALVEASGLPAFERNLEQFLATDRGRVKIVPSAIQVQEITSAARLYIEDALTLLDKDVAELNAEYERQRVPLESLRKERELINRSIEHHLDETRWLIEESARRMLLQASTACPEWASAIEREHKVTVTFKLKAKVEAACEEIAVGLSDQIITYAEDWQVGELTDLVTKRAGDLEEQIGERLIAFTKSLEEIRAALLNVGMPTDQKVPGDFQRGAAAVLGMALSPGMSVIGAQFGFKAMLKGLLPQFGAAVLMVLVGFTPAALWAALAGMGVIQALWRLDKLNKQLVDTVANTVSAKLRDDAADIARSMATRVHDELDKQRAEIDKRLADSVASLHEVVQIALSKRDQKEKSGAQIRDQMAASRHELAEIDRRAANVIKAWAMG